MVRLMRIALLAPLLAAFLVAACAGRTRPSAGPADGVPYRLDVPDVVYRLPAELKEISGLTILPSGRLGAVQDETGAIYEVDPATGQITSEQPFAGKGDYEGVELTPDAVWVLRSDGDLYRVSRTDSGLVESRKIETDLASRNDTEGLAYDAAGGRLLIACKEDPGGDRRDVRTIYAFDLATETLGLRPVAVLDREAIDAGDLAFKPSALAVEPQTGRLYVLSSVRKALAVLNPDGTLLTVVPLSSSLFPQPEGIAFAADGTLFIASEGPAGPGTILRFSPTDA